MTERLDNLSKDILTFLEKHEPNVLRWTEIVEGLWPFYRFHYKNERGFGVALTQKLKFLKKEGLIKKESGFYGTVKSTFHIEEKPSTEKPSRLNFWEYWKWRREYGDMQRERELQRLEREVAARLEIMQLNEDDPHLMDKINKIRKKYELI